MTVESPTTTAFHAHRADDSSRPACGSKTGKLHYNSPLHVLALLIILVLSTFACAFPIVARRFPKLPIPHRFLFLSKHFGTGVLLATAFVHLLPTAFVSLTDPCLPPFWNEGYPAMAGLISLVAVLVVVGVEMFFAIRGAGHVHGGDYGIVESDPASASTPTSPGMRTAKNMTLEGRRLGSFKERRGSLGSFDFAVGEQMPRNTTSHVARDEEEVGIGLSNLSDEAESDLEDEFDDASTEEQSLTRPVSTQRPRNSLKDRVTLRTTATTAIDPQQLSENNIHGTNAGPAGPQNDERKLLLQCLLLEAGILFHSVFIGMALSVAVGTSFVVLLVAISFHQTFEGFALGSRIAAINSFGPDSIKPWLMALAYGVTTPIGQAIGLVVHNMYDPASEMGLIMVGLFNSMSSGLLVFAGLVELLAPDFLSDESYQNLRGRKRLEACGAVVAGALLMALVGAWA